MPLVLRATGEDRKKMFSKITRLGAAPFAAGLLAVSLAGCMSIESAEEPTEASSSNASQPENSGPVEGSVTPSPKASEGVSTASPNVPKAPADSSFQSVYDFLETEATETKCTDGMDIVEMGLTLKLVGNCKNVSISGTANMIIAPHITNLEITGIGNVAAVKNIKQVTFSGVGNSAASLNENTKVTDNGSSNKFGQGAFEGITF